jgi:hypothetical protein
MDEQKAAFLFGEVPGGKDTSDEEVRHRLVRSGSVS